MFLRKLHKVAFEIIFDCVFPGLIAGCIVSFLLFGYLYILTMQVAQEFNAFFILHLLLLLAVACTLIFIKKPLKKLAAKVLLSEDSNTSERR
jgi:hypothetical protein